MRLIRQLLNQLGLYNAVRYSKPYEWLQFVRNPNYLANLAEDREFYRAVFNNRPLKLIFDVGANVGDKAHVFAQLASRVVCFEPDPRLGAALKQRFRNVDNVLIDDKGVSSRIGIMELHAYNSGSAFNTMNLKQHEKVVKLHDEHRVIEVPVTTLDAEIAIHGLPDFLKVDVEGHEEDVFEGLSQAPPLVSFEANLPEFADESCRVAQILEKLAPGIQFSICGSGIKFDYTFPLSCTQICSLLKDEGAPPYLEIFAKNSTFP
jgi:FkbM family methyltransferase